MKLQDFLLGVRWSKLEQMETVQKVNRCVQSNIFILAPVYGQLKAIIPMDDNLAQK